MTHLSRYCPVIHELIAHKLLPAENGNFDIYLRRYNDALRDGGVTELFNELVLREFISDTLKPPILKPPETTSSSVSFNSTGSSSIKVSIIFLSERVDAGIALRQVRRMSFL
jgi:hypothetical protein